MNLPRSVRSLLSISILVTATGFTAVSAQEESPTPAAESGSADTTAETRLTRIREEMTASLERLERLQREVVDREAVLEKAKSDLAAAESSGDPQQIEAAREALSTAELSVQNLREDTADQQKLYDQAAERFRIAREQASLDAGEAVPAAADGLNPPLLETIQRRGQVTLAEQAASLAEQRVRALRREIEILDSQQERVRGDIDEINRHLDEGRQLDRQQRQELTKERQRQVDEERSLDERINDLHRQIVIAETTLRIKKEEAERELENYRFWKRQLVMSLSLLLAVVAILLLLRLIVARFVKDPDHRYSANRRLSLALTLVLFIGLGLIFLRQFPNMFTGIGVVLAGVAIALQEVILSFFGFFAIRSAQGYRTGDWIKIGDDYGEVVDIRLLVTILEEVTPIDFQGQGGGAKTGALTRINNSSIVRNKMINYTRSFPYIWSALTYTITYESDWPAAKQMLGTILESHDEITTTAKLARKRISEAAADLAIKVDDTAPRIRVWPADSGISLRVRFMVHPRRRRALINTLNREVILAFTGSPDVDFAYNTMRLIPTPPDLASRGRD